MRRKFDHPMSLVSTRSRKCRSFRIPSMTTVNGQASVLKEQHKSIMDHDVIQQEKASLYAIALARSSSHIPSVIDLILRVGS